MEKVNEGEIIPLHLQAHDGNDSLSVLCVLTTLIDQKEFMRVKMNHIANGLYTNNEVEMPNLGTIAAQYLIDSEDYSVTLDVYAVIPKPDPEEKVIVGEFVSKTKSKEFIIGVVVHCEKKIQTSQRI